MKETGKDIKASKSSKKSPLRWLWRLLLALVLIFLLFILLLDVSAVQNWLAQKITGRIAGKTASTVTLKNIDFSIYDGLVLNDLYISSPDQPQDTMAFIGELSGSLTENILSVFSNKIYLSEIQLRKAYLNLSQSELTGSNLKLFLSRLQSKENTSKSEAKPLDLDIKKVSLDDIRIRINKADQTSFTNVSLAKADLDFDLFSLENDSFLLNNIYLESPLLNIQKGKRFDVPDSREEISIKTTDDTGFSIPIYLQCENITLKNGGFKLDDWHFKPRNENDALDYHHLDLQQINFGADGLVIKPDFDISCNLDHLSLKEKKGFEIKGLNVETFAVNDKSIMLKAFDLETSNSQLSNYLEFEYDQISDLSDFVNKVSVVSDMKSATIAFRDLSFFFPELKRNDFIKKNINRSLAISGIINGNINGLEGEQVRLSIDNLVNLKGSISTENLVNSRDALLNLYIDDLQTSLNNLQKLIPGFTPPEQFLKLDPIQFTGDIEGFFNDLVFYGEVTSPLGAVNLDMQLNTREGINKAKYSGEIALIDFNLREWTENNDFGLVTLNGRIIDGQGLEFRNVKTDLFAELKRFEFKGYSYKDVTLDGILDKNQFNGDLQINDPNVALSFNGQIVKNENKFVSDFKASIDKVNLANLNLSKEIKSVQGEFDLKLDGTSITDVEGYANVRNLALNYKEKNFEFDSLVLKSEPMVNNTRSVVLYSDLLNVVLDGKFDLGKIGPTINNVIVNQHPKWAEKLNLRRATSQVSRDQKFRYRINIKNTKDYLELLNIEDLRLAYVTIEGNADLQKDNLQTYVNIDSAFYKSTSFERFNLNFDNNNDVAELALGIQKTIANNRLYEPLEINSTIVNDVIDINIKTENVLDSVGQVDVSLKIRPEGENIILNLANEELNMFSSQWDISEKNEIIYRDNYIEIHDFKLSDGYREIKFADLNRNGLIAELRNFDFILLNPIIDYDKIDFSGEGDILVTVEDIFNVPIINGTLDIPEFALNGEDYGHLILSANDQNDGLADIAFNLYREEDEMQIKVDATIEKETQAVKGNLTTSKLAMELFEFIIDDGISETQGDANINVEIYGTLNDPKINGSANLIDCATVIDYLDLNLSLGEQSIPITNEVIDFSNVTLHDKFGNTAIMEGGLNHNFFGDFTTELSMRSPYFLALDTEKGDNPMYYGVGIGDFEVDFSGPFSSTDIEVTAIAGAGSVLNIPIEDSYEGFNESFIKFVDRDQEGGDSLQTLKFRSDQLEGVDVQMFLTITPEAEVNIIFDEKTNDVIRGKGLGDMRIVVSREGDFNVFGEYEVFEGEYLFTAWGIIAKPFQVRRGGLITWTGDPINANIEIQADYEDLRVPTNVFLQEYLAGAQENLRLEARKRTGVDLTLELRGTLYEPDVNFDIRFPELQGEIRTFAEAKLRTIKENPAELNEQVAGLIIFRSFLPSNSFGNTFTTGNTVVQTGYNTLSEFVSNQLSYLFSDLLNQALAENGFVSGIDFEIGFSKNANTLDDNLANTGYNYLPDEVEVHFKPRFQDDKWAVDYGTSFVNAQNSTLGIANYIIHDIALEYFLTEDRRLKLRAYGTWDKDIVGQNAQRFGMGLNYRKEFGNFTDFADELKSQVAKLKELEGTK